MNSQVLNCSPSALKCKIRVHLLNLASTEWRQTDCMCLSNPIRIIHFYHSLQVFKWTYEIDWVELNVPWAREVRYDSSPHHRRWIWDSDALSIISTIRNKEVSSSSILVPTKCIHKKTNNFAGIRIFYYLIIFKAHWERQNLLICIHIKLKTYSLQLLSGDTEAFTVYEGIPIDIQSWSSMKLCFMPQIRISWASCYSPTITVNGIFLNSSQTCMGL